MLVGGVSKRYHPMTTSSRGWGIEGGTVTVLFVRWWRGFLKYRATTHAKRKEDIN